MLDERWEQGSSLHLSLATGAMPQPWSTLPHEFWGSGRDALRALVSWGSEHHGWRRIFVPSYYCQDVLVPLRDHLTVEVYPHAPTEPAGKPVTAAPPDVVLVASLFGVAPAPTVSGGAVVVEDHSHDPLSRWSSGSGADFAFASLRKTLPLPDGGVLWSPLGLDLPPEVPVTLDHDRAALDRLAAMTLKGHYLAGEPVAKDEVRALAIRGERAIGQGAISGMSSYSRSRLSALPADLWRKKRATNLAAFRAALGEIRGVTVLRAPFAATLVFVSRDVRDRVRAALIRARIYPTVYWPLDKPAVDGIPERDVDLSRRILSIHCDYRYDAVDMVRVAGEIRVALGVDEG